MTFLRLTDLPVAGKRVFIRADLNVPQDDAGNITEDTRIRASIPGIEYALKGGAAVMVTSHLGRPTEGKLAPEDSLAPVARTNVFARHSRSPAQTPKGRSDRSTRVTDWATISVSNRAACSMVASMAVASIIANAMPMQMRGPAPNGRYW